MRKAYLFPRHTAQNSEKLLQLFCFVGACDVAWIQVELHFLLSEEMTV